MGPILPLVSVPARLGKGQGAKEIGHNLAHEQPKFGHNLVRKRHKIGHSLEREWPSEAHFYAWPTNFWSQSSTRMKRGLHGHNFVGDTMKTWTQICKQLQAFLHRLSENTKTAITFCKKKNFFLIINNSGRALDNRAGRKTVRAGRSALINMPSWNTARATAPCFLI